MYHDWLDRWDEQRAARGDAVKVTSDMALNSKLLFRKPTKPHPLMTLAIWQTSPTPIPHFLIYLTKMIRPLTEPNSG